MEQYQLLTMEALEEPSPCRVNINRSKMNTYLFPDIRTTANITRSGRAVSGVPVSGSADDLPQLLLGRPQLSHCGQSQPNSQRPPLYSESPLVC